MSSFNIKHFKMEKKKEKTNKKKKASAVTSVQCMRVLAQIFELVAHVPTYSISLIHKLCENDDVVEHTEFRKDSLDSFDLISIKRAVLTTFEHCEYVTIRSLTKL